MNLEHLRNFIEVAVEMNISSAAKRLRLTQPALSRQMAVFENDTGWKLFERGAKSIRLTRDGEVVARLGQEMLDGVDRIHAQMRREIEGATIRIAYAPSLAGAMLKLAIARFTQLHPQVQVSLADCSTEEMMAGLEQGKYDLVVGVVHEQAGVEWQALRQERFVVAMPSDHPLAKKRSIHASDLDQAKLLLLSRTDYPGYWQEVSAYFRAQGINAKVAGEFDSLSSIQLGIEAKMGLAMVAARAQLGKMVKLKKLDPEPAPICVAAGRRLAVATEPHIEAFLAELKVAGELA
ncbi:LysR family transcriptional regulator [Verrucomicrobiaceae bacterium 5K15]|uniref:LysR family transcriptional regulator n=1 Tax=Oceaniferula flava TaxID=2800421 RepID=A0AAE2VC23_9BACT|nr:LysR family transcriptional regulator [Oceaniferula flavus]MBK1854531.1 LysR family transcriptional regulator [Oceaniferula flavus]MBM1135837.1 LysR family transcriptional regulator [Oceaniferula flavus]